MVPTDLPYFSARALNDPTAARSPRNCPPLGRSPRRPGFALVGVAAAADSDSAARRPDAFPERRRTGRGRDAGSTAISASVAPFAPVVVTGSAAESTSELVIARLAETTTSLSLDPFTAAGSGTRLTGLPGSSTATGTLWSSASAAHNQADDAPLRTRL